MRHICNLWGQILIKINKKKTESNEQDYIKNMDPDIYSDTEQMTPEPHDFLTTVGFCMEDRLHKQTRQMVGDGGMRWSMVSFREAGETRGWGNEGGVHELQTHRDPIWG